jgi:malonate decarboxylase gamma subunit
MTTTNLRDSRGCIWFNALAAAEPRVETGLRTLLVADAGLAGEQVRLIAVVPDALDVRAASSERELGLEEGWALADQIREMVAADRRGAKRPIISIVDSGSQRRGRIGELLGISASCAAAADAYAVARRAGHPLIALVVGSPASSALLGHGYQAHRLLAFDRAAAAGRRAASPFAEAGMSHGEQRAPSARGTGHQGGRGQLYQLIAGIDADAPSAAQVGLVKERLALAIADIRNHPADLTLRLGNDESMLALVAREARRRFPESRERLDQLSVLESPIIR